MFECKNSSLMTIIIIVVILIIIIVVILKQLRDRDIDRRKKRNQNGRTNQSSRTSDGFMSYDLSSFKVGARRVYIPNLKNVEIFETSLPLNKSHVLSLDRHVEKVAKAASLGLEYIPSSEERNITKAAHSSDSSSRSRSRSRNNRTRNSSRSRSRSDSYSRSKRRKEHHRRHHSSRNSKSSDSSSPSHSSISASFSDFSRSRSPSPSCENCGEGGIGTTCNKNTDCACGLACEGRVCVCSKPPPPPVVYIQVAGNSVTLTWNPVPGADYYNVYLFNQNFIAYGISIFYAQTVITFDNIPTGTYLGVVMSGSNNCGSLEQFTMSGLITVGICTLNSDCPVGDICSNGACVTPQCLVDTNCPQGQYCSGGNCVVGCTSGDNCPPGAPVCSNGACVGCSVASDCPTDNNCIGNACSCAIPVITGVTVSGTWPNNLIFTFSVTGAETIAGSYPVFTVPWQAYGSTGQLALSGYSSTPLTNGQYIIPPIINNTCVDDPCCNLLNFGCTTSSCTGHSSTPDVVFKFVGVTVTNSCGQTSVPTCWNFSSLCPGGPTSGTQVAC